MRTWRVESGRSAVRLVVSLLLLLGQAASGRQEAASSGRALPTDSPAEFEVVGDKPVRFDIALKPGELFRVRVWQKDSEIHLRLLDASGAELAHMSSPREKDGLETLTFVASEAGSYRLEAGLLKKDAGRGKFTILREPPRAATATDRRRVEVERVFADGMVARDADGQAETAIKRFSEAAAGWRELGDEYMGWLSDLLVTRSRARATFIEARKLLNEAEPGGNRAKYRSASDKFQEARRLYHEGGETFNEGASLLGAALGEQGQSNWEGTITFVEQALPIFDDSIRVDLLTNLVTYYLILHDTDSAIRSLREAHSIYAGFAQLGNADAAKNAENEAAVANDLGGLYLEIGDYDDAHTYLDESLQLRRKLGSRCGIPATLSNLGLYYYVVGEKAQAKELLSDEALQQYPPGSECSFDKADTLLSISKFYYELGANDLALKYLADAGGLIKQNIEAIKAINQDDLGAKSDLASLLAKNTSGRAMLLNYVGAATFASAKDQEAAISLIKLSPGKAAEAKIQVGKLYEQSKTAYEGALRLYMEISDKKHEATVMTNIGVVLSASGRADDAIRIFEDALKMSQGAEDKDAEGITLNNIGEFHAARGESQRALDFFNRALPLLKAVKDREGEAIALTDSMYAWGRAGNRRMAIFCGKQAINIFQELRGSARGLATEIQKDYLRRVKGSYQYLAELLIEEGLYAQAAQILNLYQDQQFFDLDPKASVAQAAPTERERDWARRYSAGGDSLAQLSSRIDEVRRQIGYRRPSAAQISQLDDLKAERTSAVGAFANIIEGAEKEFARAPDEKGTDADVTPVTKMQNALDSIGKTPPHKTFALYTLIGADKFYVLLLKPRPAEAFSHQTNIEAFSHPTNSADLNKLAQTVLSDLQNRAFPEKIRVSSSELYNIILRAASVGDGKSTLEAELEREKPDTLLWSLDGALSYLPVAALYDARRSQYLVEKYQSVVFTRADADRITRPPREWTAAIGFGKSTPAPPEIKCETPCDKPPCDNSLKALPLVPQEMSAVSALVNGTVVLNEKFTRESMLKAKNTPLVHIASHFCFQPGDAEGSFLLLGDDKKFSLSEMSAYPDLYSGVDLLVLSACQTAAPEPSQMGKEIDSLAELSQRLHAASVIATLWNADEIGASRLMIRFYALHQLHKDWSKAELLRRAQLDLLKGRETAHDMNLDHPYYWAPFVLYGSFR